MKCECDFKFNAKFEKDGEEYIEEKCSKCDNWRIIPVKIGLVVPKSVMDYKAIFGRKKR